MFRKWTDEETETLKNLYYKGYSYVDIGDRLGRGEQSVRGRLNALRDQSQIKQRRNQRGDFWTAARVAKLKDMWENGESGGTIAKKMGTTRGAVMSKIRSQGLLRGAGTFKPRGRVPYFNLDKAITRRREAGSTWGDIANVLKMRKADVMAHAERLGLDLEAGEPENFRVHPMWSMEENDRRQAFIAKFHEGWKGVQERLRSPAC